MTASSHRYHHSHLPTFNFRVKRTKQSLTDVITLIYNIGEQDAQMTRERERPRAGEIIQQFRIFDAVFSLVCALILR